MQPVPLQPLKLDPPVAAAVSATTVPVVSVSGQVGAGQSMAAGVDGAAVGQSLEAASGRRLGHVVGADGVDREGALEAVAQHGQVDGGVHALTGGAHLLVVGDVDDAALVGRRQQLRQGRRGALPPLPGDNRLDGRGVRAAQRVLILQSGDRRRADRAAAPAADHPRPGPRRRGPSGPRRR